MPLIHLIPLIPCAEMNAPKKSTHLRTLARQCPFILSNPARSAAQRRTNLLHDVTNNAALWPHTGTLSRPESVVSLSPLSGVLFLREVVEPDGIEPTT